MHLNHSVGPYEFPRVARWTLEDGLIKGEAYRTGVCRERRVAWHPKFEALLAKYEVRP